MSNVPTYLGWIAAAIATAGWLVSRRENKNARSHREDVHLDEFGGDRELMRLVDATRETPEERRRARARRAHPTTRGQR